LFRSPPAGSCSKRIGEVREARALLAGPARIRKRGCDSVAEAESSGKFGREGEIPQGNSSFRFCKGSSQPPGQPAPHTPAPCTL
jgi:hypothetical protein